MPSNASKYLQDLLRNGDDTVAQTKRLASVVERLSRKRRSAFEASYNALFTKEGGFYTRTPLQAATFRADVEKLLHDAVEREEVKLATVNAALGVAPADDSSSRADDSSSRADDSSSRAGKRSKPSGKRSKMLLHDAAGGHDVMAGACSSRARDLRCVAAPDTAVRRQQSGAGSSAGRACCARARVR
jgi:hypothetical protein